jgi:pimeloyl-ACP methyl ester carboxylesterase
LQLKGVVVLGHSFGGCVALAYALAYPERVKGLILCSAVASAEFADSMMLAVRDRGTAAQVAVCQRAFTGGITTDQEFRDGWNTVLPLYFHRFLEEYQQKMDASTRYSAEGFNRFAVEALSAFRPHLSDVNVRTLVLTGRHDLIIAPEHGSERLHRDIRGSTLYKFDISGHFPFIEENTRFLDVVSGWLLNFRS